MKAALLFLTAFCSALISFGLIKVNPGESAYQSSKKVEFKLIQTFGVDTSPREAILGRVSNLQVDNKGNLYILDGDRMLSFDQNGKLRWSVNKNGRGPGDISSPYGLACDGDKYLYLSNLGGYRIDKFDFQGKYINSIKMKETSVSGIFFSGFLKQGLIVAFKMCPGKAAAEMLLLDVNNEYEIKKRFLIDRTGQINLSNNSSIGISVRVTGNFISAGNHNIYQVDLYDAEGNNVKTIKRNIGRIVTAYAIKNGGGVVGSIMAPVKIGKSFYLCALRYPYNIDDPLQIIENKLKPEHINILDIFDESGTLIYSKKSNGNVDKELGSVFLSDSEGFLYTYKELPYPQICKYQVIISDKK